MTQKTSITRRAAARALASAALLLSCAAPLHAAGDTLWIGASNGLYRITVPGGKGGRR